MKRELDCTTATARHKVHQMIDRYYRRTSDPMRRPQGNRGYAQLRRIIMENHALDNELR